MTRQLSRWLMAAFAGLLFGCGSGLVGEPPPAFGPLIVNHSRDGCVAWRAGHPPMVVAVGARLEVEEGEADADHFNVRPQGDERPFYRFPKTRVAFFPDCTNAPRVFDGKGVP